MMSLIREESVWERLAHQGKNSSCKKPIVLYGMGNGAEKIINAFKLYNIQISDIFASDEFVRGHSFAGYKVLNYSQICEKYDDFIIVLAFAVRDEKMLLKIKNMNEEHEVLAPDVPVVMSDSNELFDVEFVRKNNEKFKKAYSLLSDGVSREVFINILNAKISGKLEYLFNAFSPKSEVYTDILKVTDKEYYLDLGAYDGDTIREFLSYSAGFSEMTAVEPDVKNFKKLYNYINANFDNSVRYFNIAIKSKPGEAVLHMKAGRNSYVSDGFKKSAVHFENKSKEGIISTDSVDNLMKGRNVSFIKMDVEGAEMEALTGAEETIKSMRPKLYISAYHRNEDLFAIPIKIAELYESYEIYLRHHDYIPAWETNYYAVPSGRQIKI